MADLNYGAQIRCNFGRYLHTQWVETLILSAPPRLPITDVAALRRSLADSNVPTLLMVYTQLTHDEEFLRSFEPHIHSPFSGQPTAIPSDLESELRERLYRTLTDEKAVTDRPLPAELMQRMMAIGVGEPVSDEFVPLLLEQMGFEKPAPRREIAGRPLPPADFKVLVIGAGLTGIAAGIKLGEAGYEYVIIEKNPEIGGTWWENVYPGVGVDTPSHFYSYSFELNPEWKYHTPKGAEMQDYLLRVVSKYGIRPNIQFNSRVLGCRFEERRGIWAVTVEAKDGSTCVIEANAVINAHGPLNRPRLPDIPGLDTFSGPKMHTASWDANVPLKGKRVAQIGTGASGAQVGPAIAREAAHLTIFQRSKHWVLFNPEMSHEVTEGARWAMRHIPGYLPWFRFRVYWFAADGLFPNVVKDPDWKEPHTSVSAHNERVRQYCLGYLRSKLALRPDLLEKLIPDYPVFSKRIVLDAGWIDMFLRDNVTLESEPIERITGGAIVTRSGNRYPVDAIVFATGFNVAKMIGNLRIVGRGGRDLGTEWGDDDPRSYLGITVPGYPNFFLTAGPNSAPNHAAGQNLMSEAQIHYIIECLDALVASGAGTIEPTQQAYDGWNAQIEKRMEQMIWTHPRARSYYRNSKGRVFLSWPYRLLDYWNQTRKPDLTHFKFGGLIPNAAALAKRYGGPR
jgi:4-hydroxyacetophenone monooxygenase